MLDDSTQLVLRPGYRLQWEPRQESWVLLFPEGMVVLSETAHVLLDLCREPISQAALIQKVRSLYPGQDVDGDIREFVQDAYEQQWLQTL